MGAKVFNVFVFIFIFSAFMLTSGGFNQVTAMDNVEDHMEPRRMLASNLLDEVVGVFKKGAAWVTKKPEEALRKKDDVADRAQEVYDNCDRKCCDYDYSIRVCKKYCCAN